LGEFNADNLPRRGNSESNGKEGFRIHGKSITFGQA